MVENSLASALRRFVVDSRVPTLHRSCAQAFPRELGRELDRAVSAGFFGHGRFQLRETREVLPLMCKSRCQWCDTARRVSLAVAGQFGNVVARLFPVSASFVCRYCNVLIRRFRRNTSRVTAGSAKAKSLFHSLASASFPLQRLRASSGLEGMPMSDCQKLATAEGLNAVAKLGVEREARAYTPHLTLATRRFGPRPSRGKEDQPKNRLPKAARAIGTMPPLTSVQ